jgi:hypothetical protein
MIEFETVRKFTSATEPWDAYDLQSTSELRHEDSSTVRRVGQGVISTLRAGGYPHPQIHGNDSRQHDWKHTTDDAQALAARVLQLSTCSSCATDDFGGRHRHAAPQSRRHKSSWSY